MPRERAGNTIDGVLMRLSRKARRTRRRAGPPRLGGGGHLGGGRGSSGGSGTGGGRPSGPTNPEFSRRDAIMVFVVMPASLVMMWLLTQGVHLLLSGD